MRVATRPHFEPEPGTMRAMAFARPGAHESPVPRAMPIPAPGPTQLLVRVHAAGVGRWDLLERDGGFTRAPARPARFPHVAGSEGAGVVVEAGRANRGFREGDRVYGLVPQRIPKAGCHAEFVLFDAGLAWPVPPLLSLDQAAVLPVDGAIAAHGLQDALRARRGDALVVFGASGGVGHFALQLGRNLGLRTLAVASGADGVRLGERLGAEVAVDGRRPGFEHEVARFSAGAERTIALFTAGGEAAARLVAVLPGGSRIAWPHGVPMPAIARDDVVAAGFGARYEPEAMRAFHALARRGPLVPHVSQRFPLERLPQALAAVAAHHLGRIAVLAA